MRLQFLGCGDAFGSGGRFNTCFLVTGASSTFLIDCGASSMVAMRRFGVDPNTIDAVLISHLHGDHFGGLPFLILDAQFASRRSRPLTVAGPPGLRRRLDETMEALFPGSTGLIRRFDVVVQELTPEVEASVDGIAVTPFVVDHPCGAPPFALRIVCDGKVIAYSGDTAWTDNLIPAARGADLLVCECYGFDRPVPHHLDLLTLRRHRDALQAKRLILTHLGPDMVSRRDAIGLETAEDGAVVAI